jgi:inward rectifier potassium channel
MDQRGSQKLGPPRYYNGRVQFRASYARLLPTPDLYHRLMAMSWVKLLLLAALLYPVFISLFALLYMLGGDCVHGARPGVFSDYFQFSLHTLSTIGYGNMTAATHWSEVLVMVESFFGLGLVAMGTGVVFARFARPTSRVAFSDSMVSHKRDGIPCLMFRMANERGNQVVEARLSVNILRDHVTQEGEHMRRIEPIKLEKDQTPLFALTWTAIHPIDEDSPFYGLNPKQVAQQIHAVIVVFSGMDETFAQTVHARHIYTMDTIRWNAYFTDMIGRTPDGGLMVHYENLHKTQARP